MGRIQNSWQAPPIIAGSGSYQVNYTYDLAGDLTSLYNSFEGVTYTYSYDSAAHLIKLQSTYNDANHPGTLLTANQYNPLGELQQATLGNGIVRNSQFDKRGRVTSLTDGSVYSFALGLAPDGNVLTGNDSVNGNWTYTYDDFSRLSTSSKTGQAFNYKYDRFGNRWQQNVTAGSGPAPQYNFDANNHIVGISYDAAGNITYDGSASYLYDPEGRLIYVSPLSGQAASYTYDASGRRVQSAVGSSTFDYLYDQSGRAITKLSSAGWTWSELYAGAQHVATYSFNTTTFDHADWLGTSRSHSNVAGAMLNMVQSLPFGDAQTLANPDWSALHFTGKERDSESGLDMFGARYYGSSLGRFMTPDWAEKPTNVPYANFGNPQSLNLYSYVNNNPTTTRDPDGHCLEDACVIEGGIVVTAMAVSYLSSPPGQQMLRNAASGIVSLGSSISSLFHPDHSGQVQSSPPPSVPTQNVSTGTPGTTATNVQTGTPASTSQQGAVSTGPMPLIVVSPGGDAIPVPNGASGPVPVVNNAGNTTGFGYTGGSGGNGLSGNTTGVRVMDPTPARGASPGYPNGYVSYGNSSGQTVNGQTGQTVPRSDPSAHVPLSPPKPCPAGGGSCP